MILILSTEEQEISTDQTIDWLNYYNHKYLRINGEKLNSEQSYVIEICNSAKKNDIEETGISSDALSQTKVVWYRRWNRYTYLSQLYDLKKANTALVLYFHLNKEMTATSNAYFSTLKKKKWIDHPKYVKLSKIETLIEARECGLLIPNTIITNSKQKTLEFLAKEKRIITKPIVEGGSIPYNDNYYSMYTREITYDDVTQLPDNFHPSLFQVLLEKKIELRIFYLAGECYSMAIFSQSNSKTTVDFRKYDYQKPNRNVPYLIPSIIKSKIKSLMDNLHLRTGSIDIVLTKDDKYIFLEINPIGQFGMVSFPCNYNLEKKLAQYLMLEDE